MTTRDILDFLKPDYETYIQQGENEHKKLSIQELTISPLYWAQYGGHLHTHTKGWKHVKYIQLRNHLSSSAAVAASKGVYFFLVKPRRTIVGMPGFVFYVGIAGENDSQRLIRDRLRDYLSVSQVQKRDRVHQALRYYYKHTYVYYKELDWSSGRLKALEERLHGFFMPWANTRDYPAAIKKTQRAWGKI